MAKHRVVFNFDEGSLSALERMQQKMGAESLGVPMTQSIRIHRALQQQAREGFTEIAVRDEAGNERILKYRALPDYTTIIGRKIKQVYNSVRDWISSQFFYQSQLSQ